MALTQTAMNIPMGISSRVGGGPSWDEQVVPALRKRLESESRTLARRISAISVEASEESHTNHNSNNGHQSTSNSSQYTLNSTSYNSSTRSTNANTNGNPRMANGSPQNRVRTYSQPYQPNPSASSQYPSTPSSSAYPSTSGTGGLSSRAVSPPFQTRTESRIPLPQRTTSKDSRTRTRTRSSSAAGQSVSQGQSGRHAASPTPRERDDDNTLWVLHEQRSFVRDEQPPFTIPSSSYTSSASASTSALASYANPGRSSSSSQPYPPNNHPSNSDTHSNQDGEEAPPRQSTSSDRSIAVEHWYRGEVSRNGGVGEYRVGKREEMLDIAHYGYALGGGGGGLSNVLSKSKSPLDRPSGSGDLGRDRNPILISNGQEESRGELGIGRPRAGSLDSLTHGNRTSFYMDPDAVDSRIDGNGRVLDEDPLTDIDQDEGYYDDAGERDDGKEGNKELMDVREGERDGDGYYDDIDDYYRPESEARSRNTPTPTGGARPSKIPRSTTPTMQGGPVEMQRGHSEPLSSMSVGGKLAVNTGGKNGPSSGATGRGRTVSSSAKGKSPTSTTTSGTPTKGQGSSKPANGSTSKPSPSGTPKSAKPRAKTTSPPSSSTKTRSRPTPRQQAQKEEYRRSIVNYPDPGDDLVNAIPSWTQPTMGKGGAGGNWDDVVLPVVARKKGLDGHYERADGSPSAKPREERVEPAPGTFGFDHSKYRAPRDLAGEQGESIPMDEFGARRAQMLADADADQDSHRDPDPDQNLEQDKEDQHNERLRHIPTPINTSGIRIGGGMAPASPAPFASYSSASNNDPNNANPRPNVIDLERQEQGQDEIREEKGGCCGCVVM